MIIITTNEVGVKYDNIDHVRSLGIFNKELLTRRLVGKLAMTHSKQNQDRTISVFLHRVAYPTNILTR